jgi:hypothetical protein
MKKKPGAVCTNLIGGVPAAAKCSQCDSPLEIGNKVGTPTEQKRKIANALAKHTKEKHSEDIGEGTPL